jgi:hypothetical protein
MYKNNREMFEHTAKKWTELYAKEITIEETELFAKEITNEETELYAKEITNEEKVRSLMEMSSFIC